VGILDDGIGDVRDRDLADVLVDDGSHRLMNIELA
jgi:hypothetical protein